MPINEMLIFLLVLIMIISNSIQNYGIPMKVNLTRYSVIFSFASMALLTIS